MTLPRYVYIILGFVGLVLVGNLLLLDFFFIQQRNEISDLTTRAGTLAYSIKLLGTRMFGETPAQNNNAGVVANVCPQDCVGLITSATASGGRTATSSLLAPVVQSVTQATKGEYFVPLGDGTVLTSEANSGQNWKTLETAQATFDAANFGNIKQAYFEVAMYLPQQAGELHARLLDTTTPAIFWSSDLKSTSGTPQFLSAPITLVPGQKVYKVQMYSTQANGTLSFARIRIVVQ